MSPEKELLLAILRQTVRDYIKLDPDSDLRSAEFEETEGADYKTAEDFIYRGARIHFGALSFSYDELCHMLDIDGKQLKKAIAIQAKEY